MNGIIKKLRLQPGKSTLILHIPGTVAHLFAAIPYDEKATQTYEQVVVFADNQSELEKLILEATPAGIYDCLFWACYPKGTGKIKSDIKRETVWKAFGLAGLDAVSQVAIDETWSALRARPLKAVGT